ncbi:hypothetical protein GCM10017557_43810 [Streptomyces aurantiacus]|uniref:Uncharacterized protein n=1 Tax=Streptomyces aurantiacus TaxID=47760 RepID=A0A7G1P3I0_9ACTN|nr:hypothetical protein GCM10017557_43810 [Streptomyces aurantiacus]
MHDRDNRVCREWSIGPALLRPYERHGTRTVPYPDDTRRGRTGYRGGKASRVARQQLVHPVVSRFRQQGYAAHEHIGVFHELCPLPAVRIHPQMYVAGKRARRMRAGRRIRIRPPSRGRGQSVGPDKNRTVRRL